MPTEARETSDAEEKAQGRPAVSTCFASFAWTPATDDRPLQQKQGARTQAAGGKHPTAKREAKAKQERRYRRTTTSTTATRRTKTATQTNKVSFSSSSLQVLKPHLPEEAKVERRPGGAYNQAAVDILHVQAVGCLQLIVRQDGVPRAVQRRLQRENNVQVGKAAGKGGGLPS